MREFGRRITWEGSLSHSAEDPKGNMELVGTRSSTELTTGNR